MSKEMSMGQARLSRRTLVTALTVALSGGLPALLVGRALSNPNYQHPNSDHPAREPDTDFEEIFF